MYFMQCIQQHKQVQGRSASRCPVCVLCQEVEACCCAVF